MLMLVAPDGARFAHPIAAMYYAVEHDTKFAGHLEDYAPQTLQWVKSLGKHGDVSRPTRFDAFLVTLLRRAGFWQQNVT